MAKKNTRPTDADREEGTPSAPPAGESGQAPAEADGQEAVHPERVPEPGPEPLLAEKEAEIQSLRSELLYRQAELENFKKRTEKRYRDLLEYAAEPLLKDLLPVLDNMERAVSHAHEVGSEGFEPLLEGLDHVIVQFLQALEKHGVTTVPAAGVKFDPDVHEVMARVRGDQDGMVADVYENGYCLKSRLLRPAKVTVTKVANDGGDD